MQGKRKVKERGALASAAQRHHDTTIVVLTLAAKPGPALTTSAPAGCVSGFAASSSTYQPTAPRPGGTAAPLTVTAEGAAAGPPRTYIANARAAGMPAKAPTVGATVSVSALESQLAEAVVLATAPAR